MKLFSMFKPKDPELTGRVINMTRTRRTWGHNFSIMEDRGGKTARFAIWLTPSPKVGDQMEYEIAQGLVRVLITDVHWSQNVDDMYWIEVKPLTLNGNVVK